MKLKVSARIILSLFWLVFVSVSVQAEHLPIRLYTSADGLGSSFIDYVLRDSRGFMWFATRDGLSRFDGSQFITYRVGDQNASPGVEGIFETHGGTYWISTPTGMYRFKADTLSLPQNSTDNRAFLNVEFVSNRRGIIQEDQSGTIWFGAESLYRIVENNGKVSYEDVRLPIVISANRTLTIARICTAPDGSLWLVTNAGVVRRLPDGRMVQYQYDSTLRQGAIALAVQNNGLVWAGWGREMYVINPEPISSLPTGSASLVKPLVANSKVQIEPGQRVQMPNPGQVTALNKASLDGLTIRMFSTSDNALLVSCNNELLMFDDHQVQALGPDQGLPTGMAEMAEDTAGNLWIAGRTALARLDRKGFTTYGPADGLNSRAIYAINESPDGTMYFANGDFFLSRFDGRRFSTARPKLDPSPRALWTSRYAFLSKEHEWWVLTNTKLYRFSENNLQTPIKTYTSSDGFKENQMFQIFEDSHGDIWLSQQPDKREQMGLYRLRHGETRFQSFSEADGYPNGKSVSSFVEDKSGNLWLGFYEWGCARFKDNRFQVFSGDEGFPPGNILDLLLDQKGRLWFSSVIAGLIRVDDPNAAVPKFYSFSTEHGLSSNNIRTITADQLGNIYAGSVRGVDKISLATERVQHYSVNDGLASDFVVDSFCDRTGAIWFATTGGLSRLVPSDFEVNQPPNIWLGGLRIAGEDQSLSELGDSEIAKGELIHTRNNFEIDFFSLGFRPGEILRYQYMLEGADSEWSAPSERRTVTYANLKPGSYRFLVRALNAQGLTSTRPAVLTFRILQPIWLRWWFIALVLLTTFTLIYVIYRYRLSHLQQVNAALAEAKRAEEELGRAREERIRELESVRTRIATDLHDDIGASLTQIAILSEVAHLKGNGGAVGPLKSIATASNELVETMSDIVWAINPQRDHLQDLVQRMRRFASDLLSAKGIAFTFDAPELVQEIPLGANPRREVFLIYKESLTNIVKHSGATQVEIALSFSKESLSLEISDNGKGFEVDKLSAALFAADKGGHGVISMRKRAVEMNGKLDIKSAPGRGTVVHFELPIEVAIH